MMNDVIIIFFQSCVTGIQNNFDDEFVFCEHILVCFDNYTYCFLVVICNNNNEYDLGITFPNACLSIRSVLVY